MRFEHIKQKVLKYAIFLQAFQISGEEAAAIAKAFKSKDFTPFMTSGIRAGGEKYQFLRVEDNTTVFAKKKGAGALTLQASKTGR